MEVTIGRGLTLKNPVMAASGTFGYGEEFARYVDLNSLGAIVVKGLSLEPANGNPPPRIMETPCGMLNSIGLQNVGVKVFLAEKLPFLRDYGTAVIANIFGETVDEYARLSEILSGAEGLKAVEVNVSCPNVEKGGIAFGSDPDRVAEVTRAVKGSADLPVIVKLSPNVTDIALIAEAAEGAGADAVSLINTLKGMSIDVERRVPHIGKVIGGLSGPAIRPIALRMVWEVVNRVSIPVIGVGGIVDGNDALQFLIAGARAVQVGTANFMDPMATTKVLEGITDYMYRHSVRDINDLIGTLRV
ncbi:MAG: dihydroorotate dehydrogenase [Syntrophobacterales bacterium]|jgi:dihydroorotate dehydrogenase (NAD+) catalytic subunit|nr:dihydroorotate dehydrogenase [Syntrophobacterales bacterium]